VIELVCLMAHPVAFRSDDEAVCGDCVLDGLLVRVERNTLTPKLDARSRNTVSQAPLAEECPQGGLPSRFAVPEARTVQEASE